MKTEEIQLKLSQLADELEDAWEGGSAFQLNEAKVEDVQRKIKELVCDMTEHLFIYDMCGYWQHQFCCKCGKKKYPELAVKTCNILNKEMGKTTEEQYNGNK